MREIIYWSAAFLSHESAESLSSEKKLRDEKLDNFDVNTNLFPRDSSDIRNRFSRNRPWLFINEIVRGKCAKILFLNHSQPWLLNISDSRPTTFLLKYKVHLLDAVGGSCATLIPHLKTKIKKKWENKKDEVEGKKRVRGKSINILDSIVHSRKRIRCC